MLFFLSFFLHYRAEHGGVSTFLSPPFLLPNKERSMNVNGMDVDVTYMVDGCGKKIQSTRTVIVKKDGKIIFNKKTQERVEEILKKI